MQVITGIFGQVPLADFYPFGVSAGDSQMPHTTDTSVAVSITFDYPFFGSIYRAIHINSHGLITFGFADSAYIPRPFPIFGQQCIATYWTDNDLAKGGNVHFRETYDATILNQITQEIRSRLVGYQSFTSQWAMIITFENVPDYGCGTSGCGLQPCSKVVTFQTVLTSNGVYSITIFKFNLLEYTVGTYNCTSHAQVGFNAGDGIRYYLVHLSNTPNISTVALTESNVGVHGYWMFSTSADDITAGCNTEGSLEIYPKEVLHFGNEDIVISGPCFQTGDSSITVTFGSTSVICAINGAMHAVCRTPYLDKLGPGLLTMVHASITYESIIISVGIDDASVHEYLFLTQQWLTPIDDYTIMWQLDAEADSTITFRGFQYDLYVDEFEVIVDEEITILDYGTFPNNGLVVLQPVISSKQHMFTKMVRHILLSGISNYIRQVGVELVILVNINTGSSSANWAASQPSYSEILTIQDQLAHRSPCPPGVDPQFPSTMSVFEADGKCNPSRSEICDYFNTGAKGCYLSTNNDDGKVSQCCYGVDNTLLLGPPGGGRVQFVDQRISVSEHFVQDILSYVTSCKLAQFGETDQCNGSYYLRRSSIDSSFFLPQSGKGSGGDPHFMTLDGTTYTFNPIGEFVYMLVDADEVTEIQVRISQSTGLDGTQKRASHFSAFVIKSGSSDVVQIELTALNTFSFYINGHSLILDQGLWGFDGINIDYQDSNTVILQTTTATYSIDLQIKIISKMLFAILNLPPSMMKYIAGGLVGDWDGNPENDLRLPDRTWIPSNSSRQDIHTKFGMTWSTFSSTSLFTYPRGLSWFNYQNKTFVPDFVSTPSDTQISACGGNMNCAFDYMITGDLAVGQSNIIFEDMLEEINELQNNISKICPIHVSVANGQVNVDVDVEGETRYTVTCDDGFDITGLSVSTCVNGFLISFGVCLPEASLKEQVSHRQPPRHGQQSHVSDGSFGTDLLNGTWKSRIEDK